MFQGSFKEAFWGFQKASVEFKFGKLLEFMFGGFSEGFLDK